MSSVRKIGRYEIRHELGRGGMARVFLAYDPRLKREVAIKLLPGELKAQTELRLRFDREVDALATLKHPAIVDIYDVGDHEDQPYLVMPYMSGGSLKQHLGHLTLAETAVIFNRLAAGLDKAHEKGFIHRDIKPDNVLFDEDGLAYLADFGIARALEESNALTQSGNAIGTPYYMSPEQIRGRKLDGRSDIYALGVMLFEIWAGQRPYEAATTYDLMNMHVQAPVPNILQRNPKLPAACQTILDKAMAKEPKNRYGTAREMAEATTAVATQPSAQKRLVADPLPEDKTVREPTPVAPKRLPERQAQRQRPSAWAWGGAVGLLLLVLLAWQLLGGGVETATNTPEPTATATPKLGDERIREKDGMTQVYVPGGTFQMGSRLIQDPNAQSDEMPAHEVTLSPFWLDRTEVTNGMYERCVADGRCAASRYADNSTYSGANRPVVGVSWGDADVYCRWAGGQLPTEAQWEYAARGEEGNLYPWGNQVPNCSLAQFSTCSGNTVSVGSFSPAGDSWVGAADMAGNVWEWTQDWYDGYDSSPAVDPSGPQSGTYKVLRGGSWYDNSLNVRAANRSYGNPGNRNGSVGFRCVVPPGP